jgi:LPXTG-site transpeptidase (sortase) family protein
MADMVRPEQRSTRIYDFTGRLLISIGAILGCLLGLRFARESLDNQIADRPRYLRIDSTPAFYLPAATALPTQTLTPMPTVTPTATPLPLPATRLSIPTIDLNISVVESYPKQQWDGSFIWDPPNYAAGHYNSSGNPGGGRNIVFNGHNNMAGEVFRDLNKLVPGDEIILLTDIGEFHYQVQQKVIVPYVGNETEANLQIGALSAPQSSEMVTLISCWPYSTFTSRIVVVAVPLLGGDSHG